MTTEPTPEEIRRATFRSVFRGYDQSSVAEFLDRVAVVVADLTDQRDRLASRLGEFADKDLRTEFEQVGREVASVLESAREAAETMRERASTDAARWRSEAVAEVEAITKAARADAEAMRTDAWTTSVQMLEQVEAETERMLRTAERDALAVMGESEREAHRLVASSRREADDLVRTAKMEAEKLTTDARSEHDEIIASAHRQAEAAQERTRALEQRRDELMKEMESVRAALASFEGDLDVKRSGLGLSEPPELPHRAVVVDEDGAPHLEDWEEGHTVRVIRPSKSDEGDESEPDDTSVHESDEAADADKLAAEVARLRASEGSGDDSVTAEGVDEEPQTEPDETEMSEAEAAPATPRITESTHEEEDQAPAPTTDAPPAASSQSEDTVETPASQEDDAKPDEVFELFRRLRKPTEKAPGEGLGRRSKASDEPAAEVEEVGESQLEARSVSFDPHDPFEIRERLLLPLTNQALRAIKRTLTEAQNEALEQIRLTEGEWLPDAEAIDLGFQDELAGLVAAAAEAGREAVTEMGLDPAGVVADSPDLSEIGADLVAALESGLQHAGEGSRERSAAASRVFRAWRTDEAERRVRSVALATYHSALRSAFERNDRTWRWVGAGRMCSTCKAAAQSKEVTPPAHKDCNCTIVPSDGDHE